MSPLQGCAPCINKMLGFAVKYSNKGIAIIISGEGKKEIKLRLASEDFQIDNYLMDYKGYAKRLDLISGYPCIYYCKNDKVIELKIISPGNLTDEILKEVFEVK